MNKTHALAIALSLVVVVAFAPLAFSKKAAKAPPADGASVFKQNCAQCHAGGLNMVNDKKPIIGSSKLATLATFKAYLQAPVGHMPYYKHIINDKAALKALYEYCKTLKPAEAA